MPQEPTQEAKNMCSPVKCETCGKVTWSGCGEHVDQVKSMFTEEEWCTCARWGL